MNSLLERIERLMQRSDESGLDQALGELRANMDHVAEEANRRLDRLGVRFEQAPLEVDLRELFAEVIQELCQFAAAQACSLSILRLPPPLAYRAAQTTALEVLDDCAQRLKIMLDHLRHVVGNPATLTPDPQALYGDRVRPPIA